jgi:glycosyltransferase involved in cell wall biosynthesis
MRATFVYLNSRRELLEGIERGEEPDSSLYGALQLREHGVDVRFHDPYLTRVELPSLLTRIAWNARELTVPFEVGRTDVVVSSIAASLPLAARARRLPVVALYFGLNLIWRRSSGPRRALLRASLRSATRVLCIGEAQRLELIDAASLDEERVVTLHVPIDAEFFRPESESGEGTVLAVGKDLARDYGTLGEAARSLDTRVTLVAHPRNLEGLELPSNVESRSDLPYPGLRAAYARAGCVVVPQHADDYAYGSEGGGLTALLEAMAMGKAVVASDRAVLHDYVDDGVEAILVPPGDPAALLEAIERVLGDRELAASLGAAARARVEREFTSSVFASRLAPLLRSVV